MTLIEISTDNTTVAALCEAVKSHCAILSRTKVAVSAHDHSVELLDAASTEGRAARLITTRARGLAADSCRKLLASQAVKLEASLATAIRALHDEGLNDTVRMVLVNNVVVAINAAAESGKLLEEPARTSQTQKGVSLHHATRTALFSEFSLVGSPQSDGPFDSTLDVVHDFSGMELHSMPVQAVASLHKKLADAISALGVADHMVAFYRPLNRLQLAQVLRTPTHRFNAEANLRAARHQLANLIDKLAELLPTAVSAVNMSTGVPNFKGRVIESGMIICIVANNKLKLARQLLAETESRVASGSIYSDTDEMYERIEDYMSSLAAAA